MGAAIAAQTDPGLKVVTEGELRRDILFDHFVRGTTGLSLGTAQTVAFRPAVEEGAYAAERAAAIVIQTWMHGSRRRDARTSRSTPRSCATTAVGAGSTRRR